MNRASSRPPLRHAALAVCLVAAGCGGHTPATVDPRRPANASATLDQLAQHALAAPLDPRTPGFAALTAAGELIFVDAAGHERYRTASTAAELLVCGDSIGEVSAARLGLRRWPEGNDLGSVPRDERTQLVGASVEGERLAVIEATSPRRAQIRLGTVGAGGVQVTHRLPADGDLGAPLLRAGLLLIPHDGHELLLLDAGDGTERARRRSHDDTIRWARMDQGRVYFGRRRAYALRPGVADTNAADAVLDPDLALVPAPPFDAQLDHTPPREPGAEGGERGATSNTARPAPVHWARVPLEPSDTPSADRVYVITHGHVFAFDGAGAFRFVHTLTTPPVATLATADGLTLLHADGRLEGLHPDDGSLRFEQALPPLRSAQAVPGTGPDTRTVEARPPPDPGSSLLGVLRAHDTRTVPNQVYAAHLLTTVTESVAAGLLAIYVDRRTEPPVRDAIAMTLRARASDTDALVQALGGRYDFLAEGGERSPPPLHAIIPALARAERTDAYAALLGHLDEPATPLEALPLVIDQLVRWGGAEALAPLLAFVRRYRADSSFAEDATPLVHAARAVDALGGSRERAQLVELLGRSGTHPALSEAAARAALARETAPGSTPREALESPAPEREEDTASLPRLASNESVEAHALEQMSRLSPCLEAAHAQQPSLRSVRVRLVLVRGGRVALVSVLPGGELERCIADAAVSMRWPRIRSPRQQVGFTLRLAAEPASERPRSTPSWWAASAARAPRGVAVQPGLPWWASPDRPATQATEEPREWWQPEGDDPSDPTLDRWWLPTPDAP
ncbi:MAG: hypothetical protein IPH72_01290 [Sandaracinaceae bacterium]|nr:hypothetical protein [Sandaracinaceae bacterium]